MSRINRILMLSACLGAILGAAGSVVWAPGLLVALLIGGAMIGGASGVLLLMWAETRAGDKTDPEDRRP